MRSLWAWRERHRLQLHDCPVPILDSLIPPGMQTLDCLSAVALECLSAVAIDCLSAVAISAVAIEQACTVPARFLLIASFVSDSPYLWYSSLRPTHLIEWGEALLLGSQRGRTVCVKN